MKSYSNRTTDKATELLAHYLRHGFNGRFERQTAAILADMLVAALSGNRVKMVELQAFVERLDVSSRDAQARDEMFAANKGVRYG